MTDVKERITIEASLLKAMSERKVYDEYNKYIDYSRLMPNTKLMLIDYDRYYTAYEPADEIDWGVFYEQFSQYWHKHDLDDEDIAYYRDTVIPLVRDQEVDNNTAISLLELQFKEVLGNMLNGEIEPEAIQTELEKYTTRKKELSGETDEEVFSLNSLDLSSLDNSNGLEWFLPSLQQGLGCIMPGQFIVVAADSNTGKSAFCISQAAHLFANSITRPILYCTSEDTKEDLAGRFLANLLRDKVKDGFDGVVKHHEKVSKYFEDNYDTSMFIGMQINGPRDMYKIKQKIDIYKPCIVIIDMLDCMAKDRGHESLELLYQEARAIANTGTPVIGTTQSGNTTYQDKETKEYKHRKFLSEKDMAGSKYGKQGAAYCAIMIGKDDDTPTVRYINTTKKKRGHHVKVTAEIVEKYSLYRELL